MPGPVQDAAPGGFIDRHPGYLLRRAYAIARKNSAEALKALGDVSPVQASALATLITGPLTQAELGRRIDMEPANTHSLIRRMAAADLVTIGASPHNRRHSIVTITDGGRALAQRIEARLAIATEATLAMLAGDERAILIALLARVAGIAPDR